MRRGFKAAARRLAAEVRAELGLAPDVALNPYRLAELYGVPVFGLDEVDCSPAARAHFTATRPNVFSAALVPVGSGVVIVENPAHPPLRRRSTLSHEMAHVLLEHRFAPLLVNESGCRALDVDQEEQADELAGELLVPFETAQQLAALGSTDAEVARRLYVSLDFARWRMNATGARKIAAARAASQEARLASGRASPGGSEASGRRAGWILPDPADPCGWCRRRRGVPLPLRGPLPENSWPARICDVCAGLLGLTPYDEQVDGPHVRADAWEAVHLLTGAEPPLPLRTRRCLWCRRPARAGWCPACQALLDVAAYAAGRTLLAVHDAAAARAEVLAACSAPPTRSLPIGPHRATATADAS